MRWQTVGEAFLFWTFPSPSGRFTKVGGEIDAMFNYLDFTDSGLITMECLEVCPGRDMFLMTVLFQRCANYFY